MRFEPRCVYLNHFSLSPPNSTRRKREFGRGRFLRLVKTRRNVLPVTLLNNSLRAVMSVTYQIIQNTWTNIDTCKNTTLPSEHLREALGRTRQVTAQHAIGRVNPGRGREDVSGLWDQLAGSGEMGDLQSWTALHCLLFLLREQKLTGGFSPSNLWAVNVKLNISV